LVRLGYVRLRLVMLHYIKFCSLGVSFVKISYFNLGHIMLDYAAIFRIFHNILNFYLITFYIQDCKNWKETNFVYS